MAGPTATHGVEEVWRFGTGTQAAGSGHHQRRTGYDRHTGSECIASSREIRAIVITSTIVIAVDREITHVRTVRYC